MAATILFDLDNTLYSYEETGAHVKIVDNITTYLSQLLNISLDEARTLDMEYYRTHGMTSRALAVHHGHDNKALRDFCDQIHECGLTETLKPDLKLRDGLQRLADAGHDLWVMTNAHDTHAVRCLTLLGVADLFQRPAVTEPTPESSYVTPPHRLVRRDTENSGAEVTTDSAPSTDVEKTASRDDTKGPSSTAAMEWKVIDCFDMWAHREADGKLESKPMPGAYDMARQRTGAACPKRVLVMVEDSMVNLEQPHKDGWVPVWIGHGKDVPATAPPCHPHGTIYEVLESLPALIAARHQELNQ